MSYRACADLLLGLSLSLVSWRAGVCLSVRRITVTRAGADTIFTPGAGSGPPAPGLHRAVSGMRGSGGHTAGGGM